MAENFASERIRGALFGLAFGDALGAETEFMNVEDILHRWPPYGPRELAGNPVRVTDDTQMAIAVGRGILAPDVEISGDPRAVERRLREEFVRWYRSPDNDRAPGMTCMQACAGLEHGNRWQDASVIRSKGCGANMRVAPVAFLPSWLRPSIAQFQGALTHGHPTALAASDLTAFAVAALASGTQPQDLLPAMRRYVGEQREIYDTMWLGDLWERSSEPTPAAFIALGWDECSHALDRLERGLEAYDGNGDPCLLTGDGWIAEEALATGLLCFLTFFDDPLYAIYSAVVTRGDSDSIACLAGAFAGAYHGDAAWPADWYDRIEYADELESLVQGLAAL